LLTLCSALTAAQQPTQRPSDPNETINRLNKRLEELEARLKELEAKQANAAAQANSSHATPPPEAASDEAKEPAEKTEAAGGMDGMPGMPAELPTMKFNGFTDVQYLRRMWKAYANLSREGVLAKHQPMLAHVAEHGGLKTSRF
jgi:TolA-binding protein